MNQETSIFVNVPMARNDRLSKLMMKIRDKALCSLGHQFFCLGQKHPEGHRDLFVDRVMFVASK